MDRSRFSNQHSVDFRGISVLVGRERESMYLNEELDRAGSGNGRLVLVGGEAGIGKTAIARDVLEKAAESGALVLTGSCFDLSITPAYGPWTQIMATAGRVEPSVPTPNAFLNGELQDVTDLAALVLDVDRYFEALTKKRTIVLLFEDLHWADPASLALLRRVCQMMSRWPMLLLATYRVDEITRDHLFYAQLPTMIRESDGLRLDLQPLDRKELGTLAERWLNGQINDRERLAQYLERRSQGNPFYAVELLRALYESGTLVQRDEMWDVADLDVSTIPSFLQQVIDSRIDRLGGEMREALEIAAIIGQHVSVELWAEISGMSNEQVYAVAERAADSRLIVLERDGLSVSFHHALTREALYEGVSPFRRRLLHNQVAAVLIGQDNPDPDAVAFHLKQAGEADAVPWLIRAGERSQRSYAWLTAQERFLDAAAILREQPGHEEQLALLLFRIARLKRYSDQHRGVEMLVEASDLARNAGNLTLAADADHNIALLRCWAGDFRGGLANWQSVFDHLETSTAISDPVNEVEIQWLVDSMPSAGASADANAAAATSVLRAAKMSHRRGANGWLLAASGQSGPGRIEAERLLNLIGDIEAPGPLVQSSAAHAVYTVGLDAAIRGDLEHAHESFDAAIRRYQTLDHHAPIGFVELARLEDLVLPFQTDRPGERRRIAADASQSLRRAASAFDERTNLECPWFEVYFLDGRWDLLGSVFDDLDSPSTYHLRRAVNVAAISLARARGDQSRVEEIIHRALPDGLATPMFSTHLLESVAIQLEAAHFAMDRGDFTSASRWIEVAESWSKHGEVLFYQASTVLARARFYLLSGELQEATVALREFEALHRRRRMPLLELQALRLEGGLLLGSGDLAAGRVCLARAFELASLCEAPYEKALGLVELASLEATAGDQEAFDSVKQDATEELERLNATTALARLESISLRSAVANHGLADFGLSSRECEVLRHVALGLTDAEVGETLFISPRTVSQHLRSIYSKLGVSSRTAATRIVLGHGIDAD